jgi:hypothetical protein
MKEARLSMDRRKQPTSPLTRYTFLGRRKEFRRKGDQEKGGYVDRYSSAVFFFLVFLIALNVCDALLTMIILDRGGRELNPVVLSAIELYGANFWIWKFCLVSLCLVLLCLHSHFRRVKTVIVSLSVIYLFVVLYQYVLLY